MTRGPFNIAEKKAAEDAGVAHDRFREVRTRCLTEGEHWIRLRNNVTYSAQGLALVHRELGIPVAAVPEKKSPAPAPLVPATAAAAGGPAPASTCTAIILWRERSPRFDLVVEKFYPNKQILGCMLDGKLVRVRVASNENFVKGMKIPARHIEADLWQLDRKLPRWKGKW